MNSFNNELEINEIIPLNHKKKTQRKVINRSQLK